MYDQHHIQLLIVVVHDEKSNYVKIDFALKVVGQNKDDVKIRAGLKIEGKEEEDVFFRDCTVTGAKNYGVFGDEGAAMHLKNVCVEKTTTAAATTIAAAAVQLQNKWLYGTVCWKNKTLLWKNN